MKKGKERVKAHFRTRERESKTTFVEERKGMATMVRTGQIKETN